MTNTRSICGAVIVAVLAAAGCTQSPSPSPSASRESAAPHEMHGPPGPERLLFVALNRLDLTADQRTKIETAAHSVAPAMPDHRIFAEVAAGVRAGKIDEPRVLAVLDSAASPGDRSASIAAALDTLHATLTAPQRRAFVDMIAEHIDEHEAASAPAGGKLAQVLDKLNLRDEQRASINQIVAAQVPADGDADEHKQMAAFHAGLRTRLETFAADRFDATAFAAELSTASTGMREHIQRTIHALAAILPVLDAAQRETLATAIETGMAAR